MRQVACLSEHVYLTMPKKKQVWFDIISTGVELLFGKPKSSERASRESKRPRAAPRRAGKEGVAQPPSEERTIHRVRQEYTTSCGVAAAAMLARVTHEEALAVIFPAKGRKRTTFYTHYRDVMTALAHFGVPHASRPARVRSWNAIPSTALVKVRWSERGLTGRHWVIFQRKGATAWQVLDPDPIRGTTQRLTKSEYSRYTPMSYLAVSPVPPRGR